MSLDLSKFDLVKLKKDVSAALADGISDLVEGSKEDVKLFTDAITKDMLEASLTGRTDLLTTLLDQLKVVGEMNRVRVENHTWIVVHKVIKAILEAAAAGALAALF